MLLGGAMKTHASKSATKHRPPGYMIAMRDAMQLLDKQLATLQFAKLQHELLLAREQVLVDSAVQLAESASFRNIMQQHGLAGGATGANAGADAHHEDQDRQQQKQQQRPMQQHQQQMPDVQLNYTTRLLRGMQVATVQHVLGWQMEDWHSLYVNTASQTSILLRVVDGGAEGSEQQLHQQQQDEMEAGAAYVEAAHQRLYQDVDHLAAVGLVGTIFSEQVGQHLGACTSINHLTMQQETPSPGHWRRVLQQLQSSHLQLVQLAAGFQEFARLRKAHQSMQLALSANVDCLVSCNPQTLVAAGREGSCTPSVSVLEGGASRAGVSAAAAAAIAAATGTPAPGMATAASPNSLMSQLLRSINQAFVMTQALMLNTFTRRQIAELIVASFPYVPRPAPLMEAAYELLLTDPQHGCVPDQDSMGSAAAVGVTVSATDTEGQQQAAAAAAAKSTGAVGAQVEAHMQQRTAILQRQVQRWWLLELQQQLQQ